MKSNFNLLYYLRKQKVYKGGPRVIYLRITVDGKRAEMSIGRDCESEKWNSSAGRAIGTTKDAKILNSYLDSLRFKMRMAHQALIDSGIEVTATSLQGQFTGKSEKSRYLLCLFAEHNAKMKELIGNGFEANTLKGYVTSERHLTNFIQKKYLQDDIQISQLNFAFINDFEYYLKADCKCTGVSAAKYIKHLKKIVNHCIANGWLKQAPFIAYKSTAKAKERTYLTREEVDKISAKKFTISRLEQVRDIFIFCCFTGLSYADVKKLKHSEIALGMDGEKWIFTKRQKTDTSSHIPILPDALEILNRYKDNPECESRGLVLPVSSNQKVNAYLKEIADICGIDKHLTFHLARHTFATTITLSNGVPIETVSRLLGHTALKTTQHYAKVLDIKVSQDMSKLKEQLRIS
ncbi:site-specific integrase [Pedobacter lithocola]|uniref:Site-specific integrase n=1 Tax=Pedobacter lithocola TaxID=1908239 RepID=A0ABV8PFP5_9SPHI